ncbi:MAG: hypothetical protein AAFY98_12090, partial [Verrucomicrobiota bacterium]
MGLTKIIKGLTLRAWRSAVGWSFFATGLRFAGFVLVLPLMLRTLSPEELGFWYTILALTGLTNFIYLGFSPMVQRAAAFFWAGAEKFEAMGFVVKPSNSTVSPNYGSLQELTSTMRILYLLLGILCFVFLALLGTPWIESSVLGDEEVRNAMRVWWIVILFAAYNVAGSFWNNLLSGINKVREAQVIFLIALSANYFLVCLGLLLGWGLFAPLIGMITEAFLTRELGKQKFLRSIPDDYRDVSWNFKHQMVNVFWPNAWRIGAVAGGSYFISNSKRIVAGEYLDLALVGSLGISLQLIMAIRQVSAVWFQVKIPLLSQMRVRAEQDQIKALFLQRLR